MARPTDWWVLDLDGDPTPGDPARLRMLATRFHDFAETAYRAKRAVESLQGDGAVLTWVGLSGDAFREQFGEFPGQVHKLYQSHLMVGDALDAYAPELERAQAMADRALADGRQARDRVDSLSGQLATAESGFTAATGVADRLRRESEAPEAPDPDQVRQAVRDAEAAQQRLAAVRGQANAAQQELDLAKSLAEQARQLRDGAARQCQREIHEASDVGIQPRSFWEKLRDAFKKLWDVICEIAKWVALVAGVIAMIIGGPLAWVALAAGAILLVKAIIDFTQGNGSVLDLVFGILGVIPGVKGLTSISKLTALYKAGGVKEIAKATLTGMKNLLHGMVTLVKTAGAGAVTISKQIGHGAATVIGTIKSGAVAVDDAVRQGLARLGELMPTPGPRLAADGPILAPPIIPPPRSVPRSGASNGAPTAGAPAPAASTAGAPKSFADRFTDLDVARHQQLSADIAQVRFKYANQLQTGIAKIDADHAQKIKVETARIDADAANRLTVERTALTDKLNQDLAAVRQPLAQADQNGLTMANNAQHNINQYAAAAPGELQRFSNDRFAFYQQEVNAGRLDDATATARYNQEVDLKKIELDNGYQQMITQRQEFIDNYHNVERPNLVQQQHAEELRLNNEFTRAETDLITRVEADRVAEINVVTNQLDAARVNELSNLQQSVQAAESAEIMQVTQQVNNSFDQQVAALDNQLANASSMTVNLPTHKTVDLIFSNSGNAADLNTYVQRNFGWIDQVNPNFKPTDVNCTLCVQSVDKAFDTGGAVVTPVPKIPTVRPLSDIEANYPHMPGFQQQHSIEHMLAHVDNLPSGSRGILFVGPASGSGHVMNVVKDSAGRIVIVDGQSGGLGFVPSLGPKDPVYFMQTH
ncbi:toxin glutamine deamidase domain-containing protein [Solwaraspora sp. WMMD791]|uniref:toxin glutamine deamidase domain-containing protein n=1 Tax=Solwaraspora sp. WMMD791 TaxID=3016086 RepID=UPI00249B15AC|nr:toxin glutamine deamidase domain-containing protein [Solwaraspora sp. WMMD791]WFE30095.1 toxin glutamine deamidase domain-containing protein [Solwaraspora sp. WMMD791]